MKERYADSDALADDTVAAIQASEPETLIHVVHKVCGGTIPSFLQIAASAGKEGGRTRCPSCGARDRNRHVWLYLKNKTNLFSDQAPRPSFRPRANIPERLRSNRTWTINADLQRP